MMAHTDVDKRSCAIHDGGFHADEVTACAILLLFGLINREQIYRTRDVALILRCDFVCDVGGIYDPATRRFDHHQSSYTGSLSSAGMVLLYLRETAVISSTLYEWFRKQLVHGVDLIDNGLYTPPVGVATFSQVVSSFLPIEQEASFEEMQSCFDKALDFVFDYVKSLLARFLYVEKARDEVELEMKKGEKVLVFDRAHPWQDAFFELSGEFHPALFVVMPVPGGNWKLRGIPPSEADKMAVRRPLPKSWAGLADEELAKASGIEGAIFCHKGRFVSFWKSKEDALAAFTKTMELS